MDFNHVNQVEANQKMANIKMNPHNKAILGHLGKDLFLKNKADIQVNSVDVIDNQLTDDPYHPDYVKVEEEMDLWDEYLEDIHADLDADNTWHSRLFLSKNIFNGQTRHLQEGVYLYLRQLDKLQ